LYDPSRDMLVCGAAPVGATGTVFGFVYSGLDLGAAMTPPSWLAPRPSPAAAYFRLHRRHPAARDAAAFVVGHKIRVGDLVRPEILSRAVLDETVKPSGSAA
jgi:hypothetical protein